MAQFINYNHQLVPEKSLLFGVDNRSFRYGDGLFETMRLINGKVMFVQEHAERLQKGMQMLHFTQIADFDVNFLQEKALELCRINKHTDNARLRLNIFRDGGGLYAPNTLLPTYVLESMPYTEALYSYNTKGLLLEMFDKEYKYADTLANLKTNNALIYVLAGIFRQQKKVDDVLILNHEGYLCETGTSNVFVVYQGTIYTPALSEGCIEGIMRKKIIEIIHEHQLPFQEARIDSRILKDASEIFITNAVKGVQWVMGVGEKRYFRDYSVKIAQWLNDKVLYV